MSDYSSTFSKTTGQTVEASDFSTEFDAIETASATKYDDTTGTLVISQINDQNGNELVKCTTTASAVNEISLKNNATGLAPELSVTGNDTNIDFDIVPKGTGTVNIPKVAITTGTITTLQVATTLTLPAGSVERADLEADIIDGTKLADDAIAAEHIADDAVVAASLNTGTLTYGTLSLASGGNTLVPEGLYQISMTGGDAPHIEIYTGSAWVACDGDGFAISDGTNVRVSDNGGSGTPTVHYRKLA